MAKLRYDCLNRKLFFKKMITAYLDDHPIMRELIYDINKEKIKKSYKKRMVKDTKEKEKVIEDFALDENEIYDIFDAIEKENPDL